VGSSVASISFLYLLLRWSHPRRGVWPAMGGRRCWLHWPRAGSPVARQAAATATGAQGVAPMAIQHGSSPTARQTAGLGSGARHQGPLGRALGKGQGMGGLEPRPGQTTSRHGARHIREWCVMPGLRWLPRAHAGTPGLPDLTATWGRGGEEAGVGALQGWP
jgi:hypothetical protein